MENGLSRKYTSFVGVDENTKDFGINEMPMMTREIKNQVPSGFGCGYATSMSYSSSAASCHRPLSGHVSGGSRFSSYFSSSQTFSSGPEGM